VYVLWRTPFGLRVRSCGEHPVAADSLGVNVYRMKYAAVVISGGMAGFGGAFIAIEQTGIYREAQTQGRGFIGLATVIFGNWQPLGAFLGSFSSASPTHCSCVTGQPSTPSSPDRRGGGPRRTALPSAQPARRCGRTASHFGVDALVVLCDRQRHERAAPVTPHIATLIVLVFATSRLRMPAADGHALPEGPRVGTRVAVG
jgi:simple sugar transport system permease protein